ncbi:hypothetical protein DMB66_32230 [Actinoplanes sp. ATCC 53533]|uniref:hypothetical protein n=1 Tax=Actinoplanes sp. ATCC 53533 TaxID=1288362 RepID=UPI000F7A5FF4|nr:hypothetical protein [Actinoplanes sp. ATCC 53533]RSM57709.1 hypothetical protein DMB66_32230 [Actinoplanes sp. ATCC 53533]
MTEDDDSLAGLLTAISASPDLVQQALRYYLSERLDDLPPEDMRERMVAAAEDGPALERELAALERSSSELEDIALACLSAAWAEEGERDAIRHALDAATKSLPVVETAVLAIFGAYGLFVIAKEGGRRGTTRAQRDAGGSFADMPEEESDSPWQRRIGALFRRSST